MPEFVPLDSLVGRSIIQLWASTAAKWRISAGRLPRKKRLVAPTDSQVLEDTKRMPMLFSPTIGAG